MTGAIPTPTPAHDLIAYSRGSGLDGEICLMNSDGDNELQITYMAAGRLAWNPPLS